MSKQRIDSYAMAGAGSKNRTVQGIDQRLLIFTFLLRNRDGHPTGAKGPYAPWRLITSVGDIAARSGTIFLTSVGKDGLI